METKCEVVIVYDVESRAQKATSDEYNFPILYAIRPEFVPIESYRSHFPGSPVCYVAENVAILQWGYIR